MPDNNPPLPSSASPDAIAAAWIARRDRGLGAQDAAELATWLRADPRHAEAFAQCEAAWDALPDLRKLPEADLAELFRSRRPRRELGRISAVAAVATIAAGLIFVVSRPSPEALAPASSISKNYHSPADAEMHFVLPDGSAVDLHRGSALTYTGRPEERRVVLWRGEAHFTVAKQTPQPFVVRAGTVTIRDLGTAFNVRREVDRVAVLVTQGRVEVSRDSQQASGKPAVAVARLNAGERAVVSIVESAATAEISTPAVAETQRALAWKTRQLVFDRTPLKDAVVEFNRGQGRRLVVADADTGAVLLSGSFQSDSIDAFVRLLEGGFGITAEVRDENEIVLRKTR